MAKLTNRVNFFRPVSRWLKRGGFAPIKEKSKRIYAKIISIVEKRPVTSFLGLLLVLLILIALGNFIRKPQIKNESTTKEPIAVETYSIGGAPKITVPAQVEKSGVIQIEALTAGIVNKINVKEGQTVRRGQTLISISSNYQGANAASVQRQIANTQAQAAQETFSAQKDLIARLREVAQKTDANADELREITQKSVDETKSLVTLNESILSTLDNNIKQLEATNVGGSNDAAILQSKQLESQFLSATNQARSSLRNAALGTDENKSQAQLSNLQKDTTIKQLDLQEKTLKLNLEVANLQVKLAQISESLFFPSSPFSGIVERVHVRPAQQVSPGTLLVSISSGDKSQTAVAYVPQNIATRVSKLDSSILTVANQKYEVTPIYISGEAVNGQLFAIIFPIPQEAQTSTVDKEFINVEVPIGYSYTSESTPYVPLDSVHQTQDEAVVFVIVDQKAEGKTVTLGQVQGNFIEITSGLSANDTVIVSRNIVADDPVKPKT